MLILKLFGPFIYDPILFYLNKLIMGGGEGAKAIRRERIGSACIGKSGQ